MPLLRCCHSAAGGCVCVGGGLILCLYAFVALLSFCCYLGHLRRCGSARTARLRAGMWLGHAVTSHHDCAGRGVTRAFYMSSLGHIVPG